MAAPIKNRASRNYKFWIYDSNLFDKAVNPISGVATAGIHTQIADITTQSRDKQINMALNKPGQVTFRLPLSSSAALQVVGYEITRCLVVYVDDVNGNPVARWSGPIWNVELGTDNNSVNVTAVGWLELLNHRELRRPVYFTALDAGVIATRLLSTANLQNSNQNVVNANIGATNSQRTGVGAGGASAEDLLFGSGDFESASDYVLADSTNRFDAGYPTISNEWAVSGSNSLKLKKSTGSIGTSGVVYATPPAANSVPVKINGNFLGAGSPVDPSSTYEIRYNFRVSASNGSVGTGFYVYWLDSATNYISRDGPGNTAAVGTYSSSYFTTSPSNAAYMIIRIEATIPGSAGDTITAYWDGLVASKTAVNTVPTPIQIGTVANPANPVGANRTRSYVAGQKIGLAIEELSSIESGFDYEVALVPTVINGVTTLIRKLNIGYATIKGTINGIGTDQQNTFFGHRWGPNNVLSIRQTNDSSKLANRINARSSTMTSLAQDPASILLRGMMEDSISISDVGVTPSTLLAYAGAEVVYRGAPFKLYNITPFPWDGDTPSRIPRVWVDYAIGDICYLVADNGALQIGRTSAQPIRIFGATIAIDMEGNERVTSLQTAYN